MLARRWAFGSLPQYFPRTFYRSILPARSSSFPPTPLPSQGKCDSAADLERSGGKSKRPLIMFAKEIFDACVQLRIVGNRVSHAEIKLLIARREVSVGQKHCVSLESVAQKR